MKGHSNANEKPRRAARPKLPEGLKNEILERKRNYRAKESLETRSILEELGLNTVCESALCPNRGKCFGEKVATFLILGNRCTRGCSFCAVDREKPAPPDEKEIDNVAVAAKRMGLRYVVLTSPTRDDLPDGGAAHYRAVIERLSDAIPGVRIEALIPDLGGDENALSTVLSAKGLTVLAHNLETVPSLYDRVRKGADYGRSLELIARVKRLSKGIYSKSGIMAGMGETPDEVLALMRDLRGAGCDIFTIGQYIAPSIHSFPVAEYASAERFEFYAAKAREMGFLAVASSALVRSSYLAETTFFEMRGSGA